jgi:tetratricopeptide (TPR) repeat protein
MDNDGGFMARIDAGAALLAEGRHEEAARVFTEADGVARASGEPAARLPPLLGLMRVAEAAGAMDAAVTLAGHLARAAELADVPQMVALALVARARHLQALGRFEDALDACPMALELAAGARGGLGDGLLAEAHLARAFALLGLGRASEAVSDLEEARRLGAPWTREHRLSLALARARSGDASDPVASELSKVAAEASQADPPDAASHRLALVTLIELELGRGHIAAAEAALTRLGQRPSEADALVAWLAAELALERGAPAEALAWLEARPHDEPSIALAKGRALTALGRAGDAVAPLMKASRAGSSGIGADAQVVLAELRLRAGDVAGCLALASEVASRADHGPRARALMMAARAHAQRGQLPEADAHAAEAFAAARATPSPRLAALVGLEALRLGLRGPPEDALIEAIVASGDARLAVEEALLRAAALLAEGRLPEASAHLARASIHAGEQPDLTALVASTAARLGLGGALDVA